MSPCNCGQDDCSVCERQARYALLEHEASKFKSYMGMADPAPTISGADDIQLHGMGVKW